MSADGTALEWAFSEHEPEKLVGFVVVFVLGPGAADIAEGGICGEDHERVVNGSEVGQLSIFQIVVGLHVEGVATYIGLPLGRDLIECLLGRLSLNTVVRPGWLSRCLDVLDRGAKGSLKVFQRIQDVEAECSFNGPSQHSINMNIKSISKEIK